MRAGIAMGADIDHEGTTIDVDLVGAEREQNIDVAGGHLQSGTTALARHETDVERADPRSRIMQN